MVDEKEIEKIMQYIDSHSMSVVYDSIFEEFVKIGEPTIPHLIKALKNNNCRVRHNAVFVLGLMGRAGHNISAATSVLIGAALNDEDFNVRDRALTILGEMEHVFAIRYLFERASMNTFFPQEWDVKTLIKIGKPAVPVLIEYLNHDDSVMRLKSSLILCGISKKIAEKEEYVSALKIIKDSTSEVRKIKKKKARRNIIRKFAETTQQIHDKMNPDNKKFHKPVKHQPVRAIRKKVMTNG